MTPRHRRSTASWFCRFTMRSDVRYFAVLLIVGGWTLALYAANTPGAQDETSVHLAFAGTVLGGFLGFMGVFAGITRWVAVPAARQVMAEHTRLGTSAHPELVARAEWDSKHVELMREVMKAGADLRELRAELRAGGMSNEAPR